MLSSTTTKRHHYGAPYTLFFSVAPANQLLRPYDCRMWTALATVYEGLQRSLRMLPFVKEADAKDPDSPMRSKHTLAHSSEQTGYHKRLLALGERGVMGTDQMAGSYLAVAEYEMRDGVGEVDGDGGGEEEGRGDWALAAQYLEKVASTNAPQRDKAEEMLRELRLKEARLAASI